MTPSSPSNATATSANNDTKTNSSSSDNNSSDQVWSLSVKAIGSALKHCQAHSNDEEDEFGEHQHQQTEKNFTVTVSPDDGVTSLYDQIEGVTGLKAHQQRLIYRGRLIQQHETDGGNHKDTDCTTTKDAEPKIKDITGLADGHTIHLVKREGSPNNTNNAEPTDGGESNSNHGSTATATANNDETGAAGSAATSSLLAALIGLGGMEDASSSSTSNHRRLRGSRLGRSRRPPYRLTAEDWQRPDPGSLEPVRQSLMTLHTMLPHAASMSNTNNTSSSTEDQPQQQQQLPSPLDANRTWYKGQWIDVRDTVNCWLEATIVDMVRPDEILPPQTNQPSREEEDQSPSSSIIEPATDPAVFAGDLEGRRRLLLEPCDEGDFADEGGELAGFRRRTTNAGVRLLLIHYNGWPHRWDEWIRSDSERIRPFRTRTRHPSMSSYSSPSVQTVYNETPPTHILRGGEEDNPTAERLAVLPELHRAVSAINELLAAVAEEEEAETSNGSATQSQSQQEDLPWAVVRTDQNNNAEQENEDDLDVLPPLIQREDYVATNIFDADTETDTTQQQESTANNNANNNSSSRGRRRQLELLAPLLDRLGRTLIDVAPHVASLAQPPPVEETTDESITTNEAVATPEQPADENPSTLGGLLSLLSRDRRGRSSSHAAANNNTSGNTAANASEQQQQQWPVDPDYVDFATGVVNTTRGEVRSGPRSRSSNDDVAGLLGAYLAAASLGLNPGGDSDSNNNDDSGSNILGLGRLLRDRGGGNGGGNGAGIDIHIHAVVTAPGMGPTAIGGIGGGGGGLTGIGGIGGGGGGGTFGMAAMPGTTMAGNNIAAARASLSSPARERRGSGSSLLRMRQPPIIQQQDEEDLGLFDELYSENPAPVDPNGSPVPGEGEDNDNSATINAISRSSEGDFLTRLAHSRSHHTSASGISRHDPVDRASPSRRAVSRSSSGESASRRSSTNNASPRRSSLMGRLFRRSRRSSG